MSWSHWKLGVDGATLISNSVSGGLRCGIPAPPRHRYGVGTTSSLLRGTVLFLLFQPPLHPSILLQFSCTSFHDLHLFQLDHSTADLPISYLDLRPKLRLQYSCCFYRLLCPCRPRSCQFDPLLRTHHHRLLWTPVSFLPLPIPQVHSIVNIKQTSKSFALVHKVCSASSSTILAHSQHSDSSFPPIQIPNPSQLNPTQGLCSTGAPKDRLALCNRTLAHLEYLRSKVGCRFKMCLAN